MILGRGGHLGELVEIAEQRRWARAGCRV